MRFNSKIGAELLIPIIIILVSISVLMLLDNAWGGLAVILVVASFITHMFLTTYYIISDGRLYVKCGFLFNKSIDINSIRRIKSTRNPISSPALSLNRLEISFNKYDSIIISPKNLHRFVDHLLTINKNIEITLKDKRKPIIINRNESSSL